MKKGKDIYTFSGICKRLNSKDYKTEDIFSDAKLLLDIANCFFGAEVAVAAVESVAAPPVAAATGISVLIADIAKKGVVLDAFKRVCDFLHKDTPKHSGSYEKMRDAYALLCVASFFEAYAKTVPEDIVKRIGLTASEKSSIVSVLDTPKGAAQKVDREICFPDIVYGCTKAYEQLSSMYKEMTALLLNFISCLSISEDLNEKDMCILNETLKELPKKALDEFKDQYLTLCVEYKEFYIYLQLEKEREYNLEADEKHKELIELLFNSQVSIQDGFKKLENAIHSILAWQRAEEIKEITEQIIAKNKKAVKRPIIDENDDFLTYPSVEEVFVPQHYKLLEYDKNINIEFDSTWMPYKDHKDMEAFWLRYILDPQSTEHIILVLGDPGGGKSVLTQMISAKISSEAELVVRVPLKDYAGNYNLKPEAIICEQIKADGKPYRDILNLKWIAGENPDRPMTVIFDGYDEIQQATGLSYDYFLSDLRRFQAECLEDNCPIRIIVTSRRTLIDRVRIPLHTHVMLLLDFDDKQKNEWIGTWNDCNRDRLAQEGLSELALSENNKDIAELSGKPLLLLLLAIYDADFENHQNALRNYDNDTSGERLNRTRLYDELIRRFVRRELEKVKHGEDCDYKQADSKKKKAMENTEVRKLGTAALGMFVRRRLWITVSELKEDFKKTGIEQTIFSKQEALDSGELFFGSFFFIHDSRSRNSTDDAHGRRDDEASFVFLHKTFYEFLVADYSLNVVLDYAYILSQLKSLSESEEFAGITPEHYKQKLRDPDADFEKLYMALNGAPLCAEPEIIRMISEWNSQKSLQKKYDIGLIAQVISDAIHTRSELLRRGEKLPDKDQTLISGRPIPQCYAVYLINLVSIRALLNGGWKTDADSWRFIAQYVKLYAPSFKSEEETKLTEKMRLDESEELPLRFMAQYIIYLEDKTIECDGQQVSVPMIVLQKREDAIDLEKMSPLEARIEGFRFLQDNVSSNIFSLHKGGTSLNEKSKVLNNRLVAFDIYFRLESEISKLKALILRSKNVNAVDVEDCLRVFAKLICKKPWDSSDVLSWMTLFHQMVVTKVYKNLKTERITEACEIVSGDLVTWYYFYTKAGRKIEEADYVLHLWFDIISLLHAENCFYHTLHHLDCLSNDALYDFVSHISTIGSGVSDQIYAVISHRILHTNNPPILIAAFLMLFRKISHHDPYDEFLHIRINYHSILNVFLDQINNSSKDTLGSFHIIFPSKKWNDMPLLLNEMIQIGKIDQVRVYLNLMNIKFKMIIDHAFLEYLRLADLVYARDFIKETLGIFNDYRRAKTIPSVFLKASASLLSHGEYSDDIVNPCLDYLESNFSYIIRDSLPITEDAIKVLCLVLDHYQDQNNMPDKILRISEVRLEEINTVQKRCPSTAIRFIASYINAFGREEHIDQVIECLYHALLDGYGNELIPLINVLRDKGLYNQLPEEVKRMIKHLS